MTVDDLRAKVWEMDFIGSIVRWTPGREESTLDRGTEIVLLADAEAVVERAERRVRDLEALLGRCLPIIASMGGGERAQLTQDCLDALPREIALASSPEGAPVTEHEEEKP